MANNFNRGAARRAMLVGTALGCTLGVASGAAAQNVTYNGPGPYTLTRTDPITGGPRTVDVTVTSDNATVDVGRVDSTNNDGNATTTAPGGGVIVSNTGPGTVTVRTGAVTATGTGVSYGIDARSTSGAVSVTAAGPVSASGNNADRGVNAVSAGGNITVVAGDVTGQTRGISTGGNPAGIGTLFTTTTTNITSANATAAGTGVVNAIIGQGNRVVINSGTATNSNAGGFNGTAIFANAGTGGVLLNAGTTVALGQSQAAMQVFSSGAVDVTSGTVRTSQNSDGISIASGTDIVVRSTAITTEGPGGARGLVLGANAGGGGFNSGPNGIAYNSATVTSGTISTVGQGAFGIYATPTGTGTTTITSGAITTTGANATGILLAPIGTGTIGGATTVNSTGLLRTSGAGAIGIDIVGGSGPVTVANIGQINVTAAATDAIRVRNGAGATTVTSNRIDLGTGIGINIRAAGTVSVTSGTIARTAAVSGAAISVGPDLATPTPITITIASTAITGGNIGITALSGGNLSVTSGSMALTSLATNVNGLNAVALSVEGNGALSVTSGSIAFAGTGNTVGIQAQNFATSGGTLSINSGDVSVIGNGGFGIRATSNASAVTINSTGAITTTGTTRQEGGAAGIANSRFADGIDAYSQGGAISITNAGAISTFGNAARGIAVETGRAIQSFGAPATTASTAAITINNTGSITTRGGLGANNLSAVGISVLADTNPVTITSNLINTSGTSAHGIQIRPGAGVASTGPVTIDSTTISTGIGNGQNASGMQIVGFSGLTVRSGTITTNGLGVATGIQAAAAAGATGAINITSGTINATNAAGAGSGIAVTSQSTAATTINSGAITLASSGSGIAITRGTGATGDVTVNSRDIALTSTATNSAFNSAISILGIAGPTTINSTGTIQSTGRGIVLASRANEPASTANIASNVIRSAGSAIQIGAASGVTIDAADTSTSNAGAPAIVVTPAAGGTVTINAGKLTTTGANSRGINISTGVAGAGAAGAIGITVGTANTTGAVVFASGNAAVDVTSGTGRVTGGSDFGIRAFSSGGNVAVTSADLAVTNGVGIIAEGRDNAAVTSGVLSVTGNQQAIFAQTSSGANGGTAEGVVTVNSTTLTSGAGGINAFGPRAAVSVTSGSLVAGNATAIGAFGIDSSVNSGSVVTGNSGIEANFATGAIRLGTSTVNSGTVTVNGAADTGNGAFGGIAANNRNVVINSGTITATGLGNRFGISAQGVGGPEAPGDVTITSGDITTIGNGAYGIQAIASAGAVTINSTGTITTVGGTRTVGGNQPRFSAGIVAVAQNGAVAVTSNNITTAGELADGVRVEAGAGITSFGQGTIGAGPIAVTTTGLTQTAGLGATGIRVQGSGGAVSINNAGTIATTGDSGSGIFVSAFDGPTSVTSNIVTTAGPRAGGISVFASGASTVRAVSTQTTGADANAIELFSSGDVILEAGTATAAGGNGVLIEAAGFATARVDTVSGGGDGGAGLSVLSGTGVTLSVGSATSNGATIVDRVGNVIARGDAVFAEATTGTITAALGSATATGAGADAVRLIANGEGGAVTASVTGTLSSAGGYGLFIDPPGAVVVDVAAGARVTGAVGGIFAEGGSVAITNAGTISSTGGAAIQTVGPAAIDNRGIIAGTGGTAAQLSASNDVVTLRTGSVVTGAFVGGGGTDAAVLIGAGTAPVATQTVAGFTGFDSLTVQSGYWTAPAGTASTVARTLVNTGAALELTNGAAGIAGYATGTVADNGLLVVRSSAGSAGSTFGATTITGTGNVLFTGTGLVTLDGTNTLNNTGTNTIEAGTVLITGTQGANFVTGTAGTLQVGTGGATGAFTGNLANNGTLLVNRSTDVAFNGALTGAGLFVKEGAGRVTFGPGYAFTGVTQLNGGAIRLTTPVSATTELDLRGSGQIDFSGTTQTIAELQGNSAAASINIAGGTLTVNQATSTSFAGSIVGAGSLTKAGTGTLNLTGFSTYTGPTTVNGGRLLVNGGLVSTVTVNAGGTLGGTGALGGAAIAAGGRWAPGNSIGTQTVNGNVSFAPGSIFEIEANAAGAADRVNATGSATITGGTVQVLAEAGSYARQTGYTILTAAGGVTGRFTGATSNFAFLTPLLGYSANTVTLTLARNDLAFGAIAAAGNQTAVANAVFARGTADPLFNAVLVQSVAGAQASFTALGGELNAGLATELTDNGRRIRQAVLDRGAVAAEPGVGLWLQGLQSEAQSDVSTSQARMRANRTGVIGGLDYVTTGDIRLGVFGGYQDDDVTLRDRASRADVKTSFAGGHVAYRSGRLSVQAGGLYAWHDIDTSRSLAAAGLGTVAASPDAYSAQLFAEVGYALTDGPAVVTPFLRHAATRTNIDAFAETGGTGALAVARDRRDVGLASVGIRLDGSAPIGSSASFLPRMSVAYQRAYGDLEGVAVQRFGGTGPAFAIGGAGIGEDGIAVDGGFDVAVGRFSLGVGGFASANGRYNDYGGKAAIGLRF